ncbi:unnamed protein product [Miscanthus lutarioriparius]|uniref:Uncharacterized protein n=1 Tax=Miscanthus lutarioriparius TaxID=422564 RepID=A0A811SL33_9POAL|nr:unnamed protein product [Miscanthus lutarioriparius]
MVIADLGCSSGPNTLLFISNVINIIAGQCSKSIGECDPVELQIFLNDLPGNDFNQLFSSLEKLNQVLRSLEQCSEMQHTTDNIYITKTTPSFVVKCFQEQFHKDFSLFLKLRHEELVYGGKMVLTFVGRKDEDVYNGDMNQLYGLLSRSLQSLVAKGLVDKERLEAFYLPLYGPSISEVKEMVLESHMFKLDYIKLVELSWDPYDDTEGDDVHDSVRSGINVSKFVRALLEPLIASHFGETIPDLLFADYACLMSKHLEQEMSKSAFIIMSLKKL